VDFWLTPASDLSKPRRATQDPDWNFDSAGAYWSRNSFSRRAGFSTKTGLYVKHLTTGEEAAVRADDDFNSYSVIKLAILARAYEMADQKKLNLDERYECIRPQTFRFFYYSEEVGGVPAAGSMPVDGKLDFSRALTAMAAYRFFKRFKSSSFKSSRLMNAF
jgi:hypothetical protein